MIRVPVEAWCTCDVLSPAPVFPLLPWRSGGVGDAAGGVRSLHGRVQREGSGRHLRQAEGSREGREHKEAQVERASHGQSGKRTMPRLPDAPPLNILLLLS